MGFDSIILVFGVPRTNLVFKPPEDSQNLENATRGVVAMSHTEELFKWMDSELVINHRIRLGASVIVQFCSKYENICQRKNVIIMNMFGVKKNVSFLNEKTKHT